MARPLRLEFAGALYHITSRGDRREDIYETDDDRSLFLSVFSDVCERHNWHCHAYCLMSNHYHLLVETPDANLSKGMRQLNGVYTQNFNRAHSRTGHVFQGRYKAIVVDKNSYLLELARYIVLNPVRAGMVRSANAWPWSSYRATVGQAVRPNYLHVDWLLAAFGRQKTAAIEAYKQFIKEGKGQASAWAQLKNQIYLGDEDFVEKMQALIDGEKELSEIPSRQRRGVPKTLEYYESIGKSRNDGIARAYASGGYCMKAIGKHFGLHYSRVSRIVNGAKGKT
ncbi:addiction module toxin RelE [Gammaproteobacteria bacterium 53_120_T64]|nr:addiction module toxin RelE [Gammaproteobacteria bacterium 53_120_T64]